jgi:hypothetical protein
MSSRQLELTVANLARSEDGPRADLSTDSTRLSRRGIVSEAKGTALGVWQRFRALKWYWQTVIWLVAAPLVLGVFAASKPRGRQGRWWGVAFVAALAWVAAASGANSDQEEKVATSASNSVAEVGRVASASAPATAPSTTSTSTTTAPPTTTTIAPTTTTIAPTTTTIAPTTTTAVRVVTTQAPVAPVQQCTPGYRPCIAPGSDVDCAGGTGNGPRYVAGPVSVDQAYGDIYDLDRDGNGVGCQS